MARIPRCRRVAFLPQFTYFKPAGVPARMLEEVCLSVEEAEALRLKDVEGLEQEECATRMSISRPTFHRVLGSARTKVSGALLNGKAIRIEGGNFEMAHRKFQCINGHNWEVPFETMVNNPPQVCNVCKTPNIMTIQPRGFPVRGGWGRRHGRRI